MEEENLIADMTMDEALAMCCDEYCRYRVQLPKNRLEDICDHCSLTKFVVRAFEDRE